MPATLSNPALSETIFDRVRHEDRALPATMTVQGTAIKTLALVAILLIAAAFTWSQVMAQEAAGQFGVALSTVYLLMIIGAIGGFILAIVTCFVPRISPFTSPVYAACEGLLLGGVSAFFETVYPGIVLEAVGLTVGVLVILLVMYATRVIRVTPKFAAMVISATAAIALLYLVEMVLRMFGVVVPYIHDAGPVGIIFSLVVVGIAALNLVLDFNFIEQNANRGAPRYMEWYSGFALLLTLVWLYLEILNLLAKLRSRD